MNLRSGHLVAFTAIALLVTSAGCTSGDDASGTTDTVTATASPEVTSSIETGPASTADIAAPTTPAVTTATTAVPEPVQVAFDISDVAVEPVPVGGGVAQSSTIATRTFDGGEIAGLAADYTETEYLVSGTADTYSGPAVGPATVASNGNGYTTRVLVRAPSDPARFSGRVFVEPFNTSGTADSDVVWAMVGPTLEDNGDAWVGVTVRASSVAPLLEFDPVRYGGLDIASNDLEWDILRQLGGVLKESGDQSPLGDLNVTDIYAGGYSQSGVDVATFASAFNGLTRMSDGSAVFDGYLPAAHSASLTPLAAGDSVVPTFEFTPMGPVDVPVIDLETQADVEGFRAEVSEGFVYTNQGGATVRRDDSDAPDDRFRLYEVAAAPHAGFIPICDGQGSSFPTASFMKGAVDLLYRWAEDGETPPTADRIELATADVVSVAAVDETGNPVGGVRSPFVDVPLVQYAVHSTPGAICMLSGNETPLTAEELVERYATVDQYLAAFTAALDATIDSGFLTAGDRAALLDTARTAAESGFSAPG